jgi:hypothetical protein
MHNIRTVKSVYCKRIKSRYRVWNMWSMTNLIMTSSFLQKNCEACVTSPYVCVWQGYSVYVNEYLRTTKCF